MSKFVEWSDLPEEIVDEIANHLFSKVELLRVRSICKSWRSAVANHKCFYNCLNRNRTRVLSPYRVGETCLLSPAAFFRVVLSSCPNKGWLIKTQDVTETCKKLLCPLSRLSVDFSYQTLDLLEFTVSEIHQSYDVRGCYENSTGFTSYNFSKVVLVNDLVFAVDYFKKIWWCDSGESNNNNVWTRISDEETKYFSDIIVHNGQIYALDLKGAIWWISLSKLNIFQYAPPTPMDYYEVDDCKDKRFVEYGGDLCIVHRFCKRFPVHKAAVQRTIGLKVYKMDEESVEWVQLKSLGDKAFVMATDSCFSVLAREYYGCLENSIYFTDEEDNKNVIKVFKLGDGSITKMVKSSPDSCFHMFYPPFL